MNYELFNRIKLSALGWTTSVEQTYDTAIRALERGIVGDFVECGVYAGAQAALMAHALLDWRAGDGDYERRVRALVDYRAGDTDYQRRVHLFDTFDGIPAPGPEDTDLQANIGGESRCSLADVQTAMRSWEVPEDLLVYHPGLFKDTIPAALANRFPERIAVLRLDADLYSSTKETLEMLYPLVSPGGYIIVDDFNLAGCRQAVIEYFEHGGPAPILFRKHE